MIAPKITPGDWRAVALMADKQEHHVIAGEWSDSHPIADAHHTGLVAFADLPANARMMASSKKLAEALNNLLTYEARGGNPYGHDCHWCGACGQRTKDEAREALLAAGYRETEE